MLGRRRCFFFNLLVSTPRGCSRCACACHPFTPLWRANIAFMPTAPHRVWGGTSTAFGGAAGSPTKISFLSPKADGGSTPLSTSPSQVPTPPIEWSPRRERESPQPRAVGSWWCRSCCHISGARLVAGATQPAHSHHLVGVQQLSRTRVVGPGVAERRVETRARLCCDGSRTSAVASNDQFWTCIPQSGRHL